MTASGLPAAAAVSSYRPVPPYREFLCLNLVTGNIHSILSLCHPLVAQILLMHGHKFQTGCHMLPVILPIGTGPTTHRTREQILIILLQLLPVISDHRPMLWQLRLRQLHTRPPLQLAHRLVLLLHSMPGPWLPLQRQQGSLDH
jgi:hypothetical protein